MVMTRSVTDGLDAGADHAMVHHAVAHHAGAISILRITGLSLCLFGARFVALQGQNHGTGDWLRSLDLEQRLSRYEIIEKVLPNLTAEHLKDPGYGDAVGLVRTHAKAKAALAIMAELDKGLGGGKMAQPIQIILMRRLAEYLSVPLFLVGPNGDLLFYNEPAEAILGRRFDETGAMSAKEWSSAFTPEDSEGHAVPPEDVPPMITITKKRPAYQRFFIRGLDGVRRR